MIVQLFLFSCFLKTVILVELISIIMNGFCLTNSFMGIIMEQEEASSMNEIQIWIS